MIDKEIKAYIEDQMVYIPGGTEGIRAYRDEQKWLSSNAKMSSPGLKNKMKESKITVAIKSFYLARYPVTRGLYEGVLKGISNDVEGALFPQVAVSWYDCVAFCNLLSEKMGLEPCYAIEGSSVLFDETKNGFCLPTDAQWQYASRAGLKVYQYGEIEAIAWYKDNGEGRVHGVGEKRPNPWGLYDMLGNVWEWCWDLYDEKTYGPYRVFRGGSFAEAARGCGTTCRRRSHPSFTIDDLGFRLARNI